MPNLPYFIIFRIISHIVKITFSTDFLDMFGIFTIARKFHTIVFDIRGWSIIMNMIRRNLKKKGYERFLRIFWIELKERSYLCVSSVIEILTSAYSTIYQKVDQFSRNALMITKMSNLVHLLFSYYFWFVLSILLSTMIY